MQLSVREELERKYSVPKTFSFYVAGEFAFDYVVNQPMKNRLQTYCQINNFPPFDRYPMFDPRHSIDDFLYFWTEANDVDYCKAYNLDQFGACNVEYQTSLSICETFVYFDIILNHPRNALSPEDVNGFLQYAVNANYVALARKLSINNNGPNLPPFGSVRVALEDTTRSHIRVGTGLSFPK